MKNVLSCLHPDEQGAIRALTKIYKNVDRETKKFARKTAIRCPAQCGICCATAKVEVTPLEMLPLAAELWAKDKGLFWLEKLDAKPSARVCVFFKPSPKDKSKGRCGVYAFRPLICRLFGFSANKNKQGKAVYGGCKIIRKTYPQKFFQAQEIIAAHPNFVKMSDISARLSGVGSTADCQIIPINNAARQALEKVGFILEKKR